MREMQGKEVRERRHMDGEIQRDENEEIECSKGDGINIKEEGRDSGEGTDEKEEREKRKDGRKEKKKER